MFSRLAIVTFLTSVLFVAAAPQGNGDVCGSGTVQCCNSVQAADSPDVQKALGLVGAVVGDITAQVGLSCTPVSVLGKGGNKCTSQTACCVGNEFEDGAVIIGCNNISL
ncbi:hypothetical protein V5O48_011606 [Marasmius crinis-equi]|uniref:Hydrophobin n=1 Tax=Marasmius crinis-equi TaxID=585013 RepID=A0ABR3F5E1_9AGAR